MSAQPNTTPRNPEVVFPANLPVTVALKYPQGRVVSGRNGERIMYTVMHEGFETRMFVDPSVCADITALAINVREPFAITKHQGAGKGAPISWSVARLNASAPAAAPSPVGEQADGTFAVPKLPPASAASATPETPRKPVASARTLVDEVKLMVDQYAEVLEYGLTKHNGRVKPDEIQRLFTTAYIQKRQYSSVA